jgi:small-conductance mechanosensitive channel
MFIEGSFGHNIAVLIHVLLFVYWLGGDLGVFYSSRFVVRPDLKPESRVIAAKIMLDLDLIPRICMTLMITVGGLLTEYIGIPHPWWQMAGIILLGPVWLFMVLFLHFREGTDAAKKIAKYDMALRWAVVIAIPISVGYSVLTDRLTDHPWVAVKLLIFAGLVLCGIMVRTQIGPFFATLIKLRKGQEVSDADNEAMIASLGVVRRYVFTIWVGVFLEGAIGIFNRSGIEYTAMLG